MVLAKPIYEPIPYLYLLIAIGLFFLLDSPLALLSCALFYIAGSMVWVKRSMFRRDQRIKASNGHSHIQTRARNPWITWPVPLYEALPFIYMAIGFVILYVQPDRLGFILAGLCWFGGSLILALRSANRHRH